MEEKKNKQEELQTRREFFKKAAKGVLPVLGAIALANVPLLSHAMEEGKTPMGCANGRCTNSCTSSCGTSCSYNCTGTCKGGCGGCDYRCTGGCSGGCQAKSY